MMPDEKKTFERILESAIVVSWADLIHGVETGLIHIEYSFAPTDTLDYLKVWSSITRGHWLLACEYWMSASTFHSSGTQATTTGTFSTIVFVSDGTRWLEVCRTTALA